MSTFIFSALVYCQLFVSHAYAYIGCCHCFVRIREKDRGQSYALSISFRRTTKHYKIDKRKVVDGDVLAIEEGPTFENLMDVSSD